MADVARRASRRPSLLLWVLAALALAAGLWHRLSSRNETPFSFDAPGPYRVVRVIDGDTLLLEGDTRVRLIGVDTPELARDDRPAEPWALEAAEFTRRHVAGRDVTLAFDRERRDRYRRVLAYVYIGDWFLNEELILAGYSSAETRFSYSEAMKRRFRDAEQHARDARRGMWGGERGAGSPGP